MSWIERINTDFKITTGDKAQYYPKWVNARKSVEYNYTEFVFKETTGSLVKRRLPRGKRYELEIYFDGPDCFDTSDAFDKSAANARAWTIEHPVYGQLVVQPLGLSFDNSVYNITKITGTVVETIDSKAIITGTSAPETIVADAAATQTTFTENFSDQVPTPSASTLQAMTGKVNALYATISGRITDAFDFSNFTNAYNQANGLINAATSTSYSIVAQIQDIASFPSSFAMSVANRLQLMHDQFAALFTDVLTFQTKLLYENNAGTVILGMCVASVTNYDYVTRNQVLDAVETILGIYNTYIENLDLIQTPTGGELDSYIPNADCLTNLSAIVNYTLSSLFDLAASAKQQRSMYVPEDTNIILLANTLYGLLPDDSTIDALKLDNNIGLEEILEIKKGRQIIYYV